MENSGTLSALTRGLGRGVVHPVDHAVRRRGGRHRDGTDTLPRLRPGRRCLESLRVGTERACAFSGQPAEQLLEVMTLPRSKRRWRRWARWGPCWICRIGSLSTESPSPEGDGFGRHKHARPAEASFRSRPDRRLSAAALRRFRSLRDLLKASPKGEGFHPSPRGTLTGVTIEPLRKTRGRFTPLSTAL